MIKLVQSRTQCRLEAYHAIGSIVKLDDLFVIGVRGVTTGDAVNSSVFETLENRKPILLRAQRRVHFEVRVELANFEFRKSLMVRRGLCVNVYSTRFGPPNDVDRIS